MSHNQGFRRKEVFRSPQFLYEMEIGFATSHTELELHYFYTWNGNNEAKYSLRKAQDNAQ
jgi:hypothetical protein